MLQTQGVVILIGTVVPAATGVKKRSRGQGLFLVSVKQSRTIFKLSNSGQDFYVLHVRIAHSVVKCVQSNRPSPVCDAVKWSSNKNDSQNFLTLVTAVTTASTYWSNHPLTFQPWRVFSWQIQHLETHFRKQTVLNVSRLVFDEVAGHTHIIWSGDKLVANW